MDMDAVCQGTDRRRILFHLNLGDELVDVVSGGKTQLCRDLAIYGVLYGDIYDSGAEVHDSIQLISELLRAVFAGDDTHKWEIGSAVRSVHDISSGSGQYIQA